MKHQSTTLPQIIPQVPHHKRKNMDKAYFSSAAGKWISQLILSFEFSLVIWKSQFKWLKPECKDTSNSHPHPSENAEWRQLLQEPQRCKFISSFTEVCISVISPSWSISFSHHWEFPAEMSCPVRPLNTCEINWINWVRAAQIWYERFALKD